MILPGRIRRMYAVNRSTWGFAKVPGGWRVDHRRKGGRIRSATARTCREALNKVKRYVG